AALVRVRPGNTGERPAVDDGEGVAADRVAIVEGHQAAGGVIAGPAEDLDRGGRAANGEIADQQDVAVGMRAGEGTGAVGTDGRALADVVAEEPEASGGIATVVEAVEASVQQQVDGMGCVAGDGDVVGGSVGVGDVVLALRLGGREQPGPVLDAL